MSKARQGEVKWLTLSKDIEHIGTEVQISFANACSSNPHVKRKLIKIKDKLKQREVKPSTLPRDTGQIRIFPVFLSICQYTLIKPTHAMETHQNQGILGKKEDIGMARQIHPAIHISRNLEQEVSVINFQFAHQVKPNALKWKNGKSSLCMPPTTRKIAVFFFLEIISL